jgi:cell filamentation protein
MCPIGSADPFSAYEVFNDPYVQRGTGVLKNKIGISDIAALEAFEVEMSSLRAEEPLPLGRLGAAHYRRVHHHLFQDVYSWAGKYRTVRISKEGNMFCYPENIDREMKRLFEKLRNSNFLSDLEFEPFIAGTAEFLAGINAIHPFREGNGRSQLAFTYLLSRRAGHPLRLSKITRRGFLPAMVASFHGDLRPLERELRALRD